MLVAPIEDIRRENAVFARDVEYVKEMANEDVLDSRTEAAESLYTGESVEELEEAVALVKRLPDEIDEVEENAEIDRILNAEENMTFEEMANIQ